MNDINKQRSHFENISDKYYMARQTRNHLYLKSLMWNKFFENKGYLKINNMSVLEPMCGYSEGKNIIEDFLDIKINYEGFDYCNNLVEKVKRKKPELNIYFMDVTKFIPKKKYDLIILIGGLHHVYRHTERVVENLSSALKKGGWFISFEPTNNNFLWKKVREGIYKKNFIFDEQTERAFDLLELNNIFLKSNFKIVDQMWAGLSSYIFYYNPDAFPFLNFGKKNLVKMFFNIDKLFFKNFVGKKLSFASLTLYEKT